MKELLLILLFIITSYVAAQMHENDMARNFKETGDAGAWLHDISCDGQQ